MLFEIGWNKTCNIIRGRCVGEVGKCANPSSRCKWPSCALSRPEIDRVAPDYTTSFGRYLEQLAPHDTLLMPLSYSVGHFWLCQ